jgi:hypothetical protein
MDISNKPTQDLNVAETEAAAERMDAEEQEAHRRFDAARTAAQAQGLGPQHVMQTPEFRRWMTARRDSDEAWGRWAMAMDARVG